MLPTTRKGTDDRPSCVIFEFKIHRDFMLAQGVSPSGPFPEGKQAEDHLALSLGIYALKSDCIATGLATQDFSSCTVTLLSLKALLPFSYLDDFNGETQAIDASAFTGQAGELV